MGNWDTWFLDGFPDLQDELGRKLVEIGRVVGGPARRGEPQLHADVRAGVDARPRRHHPRRLPRLAALERGGHPRDDPRRRGRGDARRARRARSSPAATRTSSSCAASARRCSSTRAASACRSSATAASCRSRPGPSTRVVTVETATASASTSAAPASPSTRWLRLMLESGMPHAALVGRALGRDARPRRPV